MSTFCLKPALLRVLEDEKRYRVQVADESKIITHPEGSRQPEWKPIGNVENYFEFVEGPNDNEISWQIKPNIESEVSTISGKTLKFTPENAIKTRHELVAEALIGKFNTDCSWKIMDPTITERTTPDLIYEVKEGTWLVMEVTTTRYRTDLAYRDKFMAYMSTINKISEAHPEWQIYYWIVVVAPHEVLTTFRVPGSLSMELLVRFRIGLAMEQEMTNRGLLGRAEHAMSSQERAVFGSLRTLGETPMLGEDQVLNEWSVRNASDFRKDEEYISNSISFMFKETRALSRTKGECIVRMANGFQKVEGLISQHKNTRLDRKAPIQVPLFIANESDDESLLDFIPIRVSDSLPPHIDHLWKRAFEGKLSNSERFESPSLDEELASALGPGLPENDSLRRSSWHRVEIDLENHAEQLSLDGLNGKTYKGQDFKDVRRAHQSRGFSLMSPTDDIDRCLKLQPTPSDQENKYMAMLLPLLEKANELVGNTEDGLMQINQLMNTDIVLALCQLSAVASELAVSLRQHVTKNGWILKKILYYDVELLIKPTNSESHVFFLMRIRGQSLEQGTFRRMHYSDGWWHSDLLSVNSSRLENMIRCPMIYLSTLLHFRINVDRVEMNDVVSNSASGYSEKMAMLTLLIALEDKVATEEMALNVRYLIMQFSKGFDPLSPPDPGPIVEKTPDVLRSRLAVYLYHQIKKYCYLQMSNLPMKVDQGESDLDHSPDVFEGLLCPFTHQELRSLYDVVQSMYIAYAKNKDTTPEQNCDFGMIKKIVQYGFNTDPSKTSIYKGELDPPSGEYPGPHEFSPSFLTEAVDLLRMRFRNDFGNGWEKVVTSRILSELIKSTHHEALATLKASADFDVANARIMQQLEEKEHTKFKGLNSDQVLLAQKLLDIYRSTPAEGLSPSRWVELSNLIEMGKFKEETSLAKGRFKRIAKSCKCHEAVIRQLRADESTVPLLIGDYKSIFRSVMETMGGVCCYLFKKNQHGGLREIYVLTFKSRLLQLLPEIAARVLCSMCPEEALTHPDKKTSAYELHNACVAAAAGRGLSGNVLHRTSSEDKSKWSQGMNVSAFSFMYSKLLDPVLSCAISRVMHAFRNKKVMLPEGVINLLSNNTPLSDPVFEELRKTFWSNNCSEHFANVNGNIFLKTPTGMWQGILHYSSSLLHVLQTIHYKSICRLHFKMIEKRRSGKGKLPLGALILDTVVSSDDSATYGSIVLAQGFNSETVRQADELLDMLLKLEVTHSRFFMMTESAKSCISSKTVGEFNSIFSCKRTYVSPAIKKVLAAATIPENEDLESRQVVLSNMYKDILEEGCSHFQVHLTELGNAFLHYTAFGLTTTRLFPHWAHMIVNHPDPHLGFLLMDLQECAGVFGFDFKKLVSLERTDVPIMPTAPAVLQSDLEGDFNSGVILTQGGRRRWLRLAERVVDPGWESYLEANPHVLYMERGITREEIVARLSAKACSKGVHDSLREGNSMTRIVSSTVYLLTRNVVSVRTLDVKTTGVSKEIEMASSKKTLMCLTNTCMHKEELLTHARMTADQRALFYPNNMLHLGVAVALKANRQNQLVQTVLYRKVRNRIEVRGSSSVFVLPILAVIRWKWFQMESRASRTVLEFSWNHYHSVFPWLSNTLAESLEQGPFSTHVRMFGFLQSVDKKGAKLNILCRRLKTYSPYDQVIELSLHNVYPGLRRLPTVKESLSVAPVAQSAPMVKVSIITSILAGVLYAPIESDRVSGQLSEYFSEINLTANELSSLSKSRAHGRLSVIYAVVSRLDSSTIESCLLNSQRGVVKSYKKPQRWINNSWRGEGRLLISTGRVTAEVLVYDTMIVAIKVKNIPALQTEYSVIAEYLKADNFCWDLDGPVGEFCEYFPELRGQLTEWTCSADGLFKLPLLVSTSISKRGELRSTKTEANLLDFQFPVIMQSSERELCSIGEVITVEKTTSKMGQPVLQVVSEQPGGGNLILLKYYGPRHPKMNDDCKEYYSEMVDPDSLLSSWILGTPFSAKKGLSLLERSLGDNPGEPLEPHTLEGVKLETLSAFLKDSFRWRCIAKSKVQLDTYRFIDDLEEIQMEGTHLTRNLNKKMEEMADWFQEAVWGEDPGEAKEVTHVDVEQADECSGHNPPIPYWALEPEMGGVNVEAETLQEELVEPEESGEPEVEQIDRLDEPVPTTPELDDVTIVPPAELGSPDTGSGTSRVDPEITNFRSAPTMYMSHCFWDNLIDRLERGKIWSAIREGIAMSGDIFKKQQLICRILEVPIPDPTPSNIFEEDD